MLRLYASPISPYSTKVHYFLEEAKIPHEIEWVDFRNPASRAKLDRIACFGKVPTIEHDGLHLSESNAILRYLAARFEAYDYFPVGLAERAQVDMLMEFTQLHVNRWVGALSWHMNLAPKLGHPVDERAIAEARTNLPAMLERLDKQVAGRKFLAGANLTLADINTIPFMAQAQAIQLSLADFPSLSAWLNHMVERPAWRKVQETQGKLLAQRA